MKNVLVFIVTVALSSSVFAIGNVKSGGDGVGPAKVGTMGVAPVKDERRQSGNTVMEKQQDTANGQ